MPSSRPDNPQQTPDYVLKVERAPLYVWLARITWVILLIVLLEFAIASWQEREPHAAILASALLIALLLAGIIAEVVRRVEARSPYRRPEPPPAAPIPEGDNVLPASPETHYSQPIHSRIKDAP